MIDGSLRGFRLMKPDAFSGVEALGSPRVFVRGVRRDGLGNRPAASGSFQDRDSTAVFPGRGSCDYSWSGSRLRRLLIMW